MIEDGVLTDDEDRVLADDQERLWSTNLAALARSDPGLAAVLGRLRPQGNGPAPPPVADWPAQARQNLEHATLVVAYGLGAHLLAATGAIPPSALVLIIDGPPQRICDELGLRDYAALLTRPGVILLTGDDDDDFRRRLDARLEAGEIWPSAARAVEIIDPRARARDPERMARWLSHTARAVGFAYRCAQGDPGDALRGLRQMLENFPLLARGREYAALRPVLAGRPAVCVAAGPSLDRDIETLRRYQDRTLVLAADTIAARLHAEGLRVDVIGVLERAPIIYEKFFAAARHDPAAVLAPRAVVHPGILRAHQGAIWPCFSASALEEPARLALGATVAVSGGALSVAHLNLMLAEALGCDPIVLVGQDLSFGPAGEAYARGTAHGTGRGGLGEADLDLPGVAGGPVKSLALWERFLKAFELRLARTGGPRVYNASGGVRIAGTIESPLAEVLGAADAAPLPRLAELGRDLPSAAGTALEALGAALGRNRSEVARCLAELRSLRGLSPARTAPELNGRLTGLESLMGSQRMLLDVCSPLALRLMHDLAAQSRRPAGEALAGAQAALEAFLDQALGRGEELLEVLGAS